MSGTTATILPHASRKSNESTTAAMRERIQAKLQEKEELKKEKRSQTRSDKIKVQREKKAAFFSAGGVRVPVLEACRVNVECISKQPLFYS
jgi:hypothetical protein